MKKILVILLTLVLGVCVAFGFTGCSNQQEECQHSYGQWQVVEEATCTSEGVQQRICKKSGCSKTEEKKIEKIPHDFENGSWVSDTTHHYKLCYNCSTADVLGKQVHSGGQATCTEKAVCDYCNTSYGNTVNHDFTGGYLFTENEHWTVCKDCRMIDETSQSQHFFVNGQCVCGKDNGVEESCIHDYSNGIYLLDENYHYQVCSKCNVVNFSTKEEHKGGVASCTEDGKCSVCQTVYISKIPHDYEGGEWLHDGQAHWKKCKYCPAVDTLNKEEHKGGVASCTQEGKCSECNVAYIEKTSHDFNEGNWIKSASQHWKQCKNCVEEDSGNKQTHHFVEGVCICGKQLNEVDTYKIVYWGDATLSANSMGDILAAFGKVDGINIVSYARYFDNVDRVSGNYTYIHNQTSNLYESCTPNSDYTASTINSSVANNLLKSEIVDADFFVILSGRDRSLMTTAGVTDTNKNTLRNQLALKAWSQEYSSLNPNGEMVLFVPYSFNAPTNSPKSYLWDFVGKTCTASEHYDLIEKNAQAMAQVINNKCSSVYVGQAFEDFIAGEFGGEIDLYDNLSGRFASVAGSYYSACVLYSSIFGKTTEGMEVYAPGIDQETCLLLQRFADAYVRGTGKTLVSRQANEGISIYDRYDPRTEVKDTGFEGETYSQDYSVLLSTIQAYYDRGIWVQYENRDFDRTRGERSFRAIGKTSAPEYGNPNTPLFLDCSTFVSGVFLDAYGYDFHGYNRVNQYMNGTYGSSPTIASKYVPFKRYRSSSYFSFTNDSRTDAQVLYNDFMAVIKPGDVFVYSDGGDVGHTGIYLGNGMAIHCIGRHSSGGGSNYNIANGTHAWEYNGAIVYDHIDSFAKEGGKNYMFGNNVSVVIIRPLQEIADKGLTTTQNAVNRMENMQGVLSYRECSVAEGNTLASGKEVTFSFYLRNLNNRNVTVEILDQWSNGNGLQYISGDGEFIGNAFSSKVTLGVNQQITVQYKAKIIASNGSKIVLSDCTIGGVKANDLSISVNKTLTESQISSILQAFNENAQATDIYTLAQSVYSQLGYSIPTTLQSAYTSVFTQAVCSSTNADYGYVSSLPKLLGGNLYGGKYLSTLNGTGSYPIEPIKYVSAKNFNFGDLVIYKNYDGYYGNSDIDTSLHAYLYIGNGIFATVENGYVKHLSGADSFKLTDSLQGKYNWCALRPCN